ncbi:hypothetical protein NPIL_117401 [Nephila pilipes]|uniref:Uncharacterized protein n=1 Tax=Nephila pilipes TaxID=299642 RepID=A0A8X6R0U4_NEPPI|nr:hypothetical protein NPIL_117401 [Nephila pilipes]
MITPQFHQDREKTHGCYSDLCLTEMGLHDETLFLPRDFFNLNREFRQLVTTTSAQEKERHLYVNAVLRLTPGELFSPFFPSHYYKIPGLVSKPVSTAGNANAGKMLFRDDRKATIVCALVLSADQQPCRCYPFISL